MSDLAKKSVLWLLKPAAALANAMDPLARVWAHARLAARLRSPVHSSVVVLGTPEIHGTGRIFLGQNLYLYRELYLETRESGVIRLGDDVVLSRGVHLVAFAGIVIGGGSMIGEYASIRDANHRFGEDAARPDDRAGGNRLDDAVPLRYSGHTARPISIGRNVWIGRGVTVLAGVTIGDGAVIGANAVVTRDVPAGVVAAGVPARPLTEKMGR